MTLKMFDVPAPRPYQRRRFVTEGDSSPSSTERYYIGASAGLCSPQGVPEDTCSTYLLRPAMVVIRQGAGGNPPPSIDERAKFDTAFIWVVNQAQNPRAGRTGIKVGIWANNSIDLN